MSESDSNTETIQRRVSGFAKHISFGPRPLKRGEGTYVAPRSDLKPGAVTRREWIRFLAKVTIQGYCSCNGSTPHLHLLWQSRTYDGYGRFQWRGRAYTAHRFAWIALGGTIPDGEEPDHLCRFRHCVTPACLDIVPKKVNVLRGNAFTAKHARQTECIHGHPLTEGNLYLPRLAQGHRVCLLCMQAKYERSEVRRKARLAEQPPKPARTHCQNGHLLNEENLLPDQLAKGKRICRLCTRANERDRRQRRKAMNVLAKESSP